MKNLCKCMFATAALLFSVSAVAMETCDFESVEDMITSPQFDQAGTSRAFAGKKVFSIKNATRRCSRVFRKLNRSKRTPQLRISRYYTPNNYSS
jgi:hypothetical protein